jgi:CMP-N-acetylneuraminic acid synthetase
MIKPIRIVALLPMRHHSERVPGKNYRSFAGKPLYHYIAHSLLECPLINKVIIDTDSPIIMRDAARNFPKIQLIERPVHLRDGKTAMNDVLLNDVTQCEADFYLQTHSTNPLVTTASITKAIEKFLNHWPMYDSLFGVTRLQTRLWDNLARAINHNSAILLRTQDLPPIYEENSCLYIFSREVLEIQHNRIGHRPLMFELDRIEAWDIDEELDFKIAEFLYLEQQKEQ